MEKQKKNIYIYIYLKQCTGKFIKKSDGFHDELKTVSWQQFFFGRLHSKFRGLSLAIVNTQSRTTRRILEFSCPSDHPGITLGACRLESRLHFVRSICYLNIHMYVKKKRKKREKRKTSHLTTKAKERRPFVKSKSRSKRPALFHLLPSSSPSRKSKFRSFSRNFLIRVRGGFAGTR